MREERGGTEGDVDTVEVWGSVAARRKGKEIHAHSTKRLEERVDLRLGDAQRQIPDVERQRVRVSGSRDGRWYRAGERR